MPIDFGAWLAGNGSIVATQHPIRAVIQRYRIADKETDVQFKRNGILLDPQPVRIEFDDNAFSTFDSSGAGTLRKGSLFGVRGHPDLDDTDIALWDTFTMDELEFTIISVNRQLIGQVQALFEAAG
jgi:hypothetical protein